ncbi:MAG TPA: DinB family protein [Tepidisphaeraceae bacterium]
MNLADFLAENCARNGEMLKMTFADFTDADLLVRPVPGANHAAWQMAHLINSEINLVKMADPNAPVERPAGFEKYQDKTHGVDDPAFFPKKQELADAFAQTRAATVKWIRSLNEQDMQRPLPERMHRMAPTVGALAIGIGTHGIMHMGQLQVIRRKLGKPLLF